MVARTRRFKRQVQQKARRIIARQGFELSEANWLRIAPRNLLDLLFASNLIKEKDVLEALVLNMLARARRLGFRTALARDYTEMDTMQDDGYEFLTEAQRTGYVWLIDA